MQQTAPEKGPFFCAYAVFVSFFREQRRQAEINDLLRLFPILICQMIRIGEETGQLDKMLEKVASWYDQELDEQVKALTSLIEPIMIVFVGGIVAVIALSIFGPMIAIMDNLQ